MRLLSMAACALVGWGCTSSGRTLPSDPRKGDPNGRDDGGAPDAGTRVPFDPEDEPVFTGRDTPFEQNLASMRIEPDSAVVDVPLGESLELEFRVLGRLDVDPDTEIDITERSVFFVPDNYLVGGFPPDGQNVLSTRVPSSPNDPAQRAGTLTVRAQATNSNGTTAEATTTLTVRLTGSLAPPEGAPEATPALPNAPALEFSGDLDASRAPSLAYPNDGVLLPPNLDSLEIHFDRGAADSDLFQVRFESATTSVQLYSRCYSDPALFVAGACALTLDGVELAALAESNRGLEPLRVSVRGAREGDDSSFGESAPIEVSFAESRVDGAVYYWTASDPESIVRFDFGRGQSEPQSVVAPDDVPGNDGACVGCHAISRQGDKMFFSLGNAFDGQLMYVRDLSLPRSDPDFFTYNGAIADRPLPTSSQSNRVLTGSFSPEGDEFVSVAPVNDADAERRLMFHDASTGERSHWVDLPLTPSQPDWSPIGDGIAFTSISGDNGVTISFLGGGISLLPRDGSDWNVAGLIDLVPPEPGKNRFNPSFVPDGSLLLYTEIDQQTYSGTQADACEESSVVSGRFCDGYSDPGSKTWAVATRAGSAPVFLARAASPGVADALYPPTQSGVGEADLMDTYPKATPFQSPHRDGTLTWFTVGSQRRAGLRRRFPNQSVTGEPDTQALIWMFALEQERTLAGNDGSHPGFFLPFQDLTTSNHMAQWTERVVSDEPAPPPPELPPPPTPPPAPPPAPLR